MAHHQDDQAESILLALKRGCGVRGLSGIHRFGDFGQGHCLRPLLDCSRTEIESHAQENQLTWITDSSNTDLRFDRNFTTPDLAIAKCKVACLDSMRQPWCRLLCTARARVNRHVGRRDSTIDSDNALSIENQVLQRR